MRPPRHRAGPARWPRALVLLVAVAYVVVLITHGRTAAEPSRPVAPPATTSTCVPATTRYPDGSFWHKCADDTATPSPAELPPDPFSEE